MTTTDALIARYLDLLYRRNEELNLTRVPREQALVRHISDSLVLLEPLRAHEGEVIDVGSGAGLPGIPLAIHLPSQRFVLADSSLKRVKFLEEVVADLGLSNVRCEHARAEELGRRAETREHFGVAIARAVAPLEILAEMLLPLIRPGGVVFAMKASGVREEIEAASAIICELCDGGFEIGQTEQQIEGVSRVTVRIRKLKSTPERFPRASLAKRWARLKDKAEED